MTCILAPNLSDLLSQSLQTCDGQKGGNILWNKETTLNLLGISGRFLMKFDFQNQGRHNNVDQLLCPNYF